MVELDAADEAWQVSFRSTTCFVSTLVREARPMLIRALMAGETNPKGSEKPVWKETVHWVPKEQPCERRVQQTMDVAEIDIRLVFVLAFRSDTSFCFRSDMPHAGRCGGIHPSSVVKPLQKMQQRTLETAFRFTNPQKMQQGMPLLQTSPEKPQKSQDPPTCHQTTRAVCQKFHAVPLNDMNLEAATQ